MIGKSISWKQSQNAPNTNLNISITKIASVHLWNTMWHFRFESFTLQSKQTFIQMALESSKFRLGIARNLALRHVAYRLNSNKWNYFAKKVEFASDVLIQQSQTFPHVLHPFVGSDFSELFGWNIQTFQFKHCESIAKSLFTLFTQKVLLSKTWN